MNGVTPKQIRTRLNNVFNKINDADITQNKKIIELWCIISDIQLWMEDMENRLTILRK